MKNWLTGKSTDAREDWRQEEKGMTEEEMVGWYHWLDGHEFEKTPGVGDGQKSLACCSPWGHKESNTTEWLKRTELFDHANVGNLISCSSSFSKPSLDIWKFLVYIILKPSMWDFKYDLSSMGDECNSPMVSTLVSTTLLGNREEDWPFSVLWPFLGLPDLLAYWMQHLNGIIL